MSVAEIKRQQAGIEAELIPFCEKLMDDGWEPAVVGGTLVGLGNRLFRQCEGSAQAVELLEGMAADERLLIDGGDKARRAAQPHGLN